MEIVTELETYDLINYNEKNIHKEMKECFDNYFKTVIIDDDDENTILSSEEDEEEYDIKKYLFYLLIQTINWIK